MKYHRPNVLCYRIAQAVSWLAATLVFKRKILRNEIKGKKGPFVVIANHEAALDFVNLICAAARPMSFVISNSFYNTLPIKGFLDKMGVIPKQQFQTSVKDLKQIKAVIDQGEPVVIYPAGLMCEDGLSTPIPAATYKFLKWLDVDVYVARSVGTYFVMPKWAKGLRPGRTYLDVYKLFSKEELAGMEMEELRAKTDAAICFDAYREQDERHIRYQHNENICGLEQVLYMCPHCMSEFTMEVLDKTTIRCTQCGYEQTSDEYGFLHNRRGIGPDLRYVSDWSRLINRELKNKIERGLEQSISARCQIRMIDYEKHKFVQVGYGTLHFSQSCVKISGSICGEDREMTVSVASLPSLPFSPGKYLELQHGKDIYRCVLEDGRLVMKCINMLKIFHELQKVRLAEPAGLK